MPRLPLQRALPCFVLLGLACAAPVSAAPIRPTTDPLALLSSGPRADCNPDSAPFSPSELETANKATRLQEGTAIGWIYSPDETDSWDRLALLPLARICSPTFGATPAPFGGDLRAGASLKSRIGTGWRELGGTPTAPAQLVPGDRLTVPEVDDAATLRVWLAPSPGAPASPTTLTDLSPGPAEVTVARDGGNLVTTLTRADGSVTSATAPVATVPALAPKIGGTRSAWTLRSSHLPKSVVVAFGSDDDAFGFGATEAKDGNAKVSLDFYGGAPRRGTVDLQLVALTPDAQVFQAYDCRVTIGKRSRPKSIRCSIGSIEEIAGLFGSGTLSQAARAAAVERALDRLRRRLSAEGIRPAGRAAARPAPAVRAATRTRAATAPLVASVTPQSRRTVRASVTGLKPLAADINGDGGIDYWTDQSYRTESSFGHAAAGVVLTSSPVGLTTHVVEIPVAFSPEDINSDISAIDDITGDGVGELVVDLDERHAIIPGSRTWTASTTAIRAPDLTDLQPADRVATLQLSSPGSPFATLDDVTGDGVRELAAADDGLAWFSVSGSAIAQGRVTELPSAVRRATSPPVLDLLFDSGAPQVLPATRVIGGQVIALRWPKAATTSSPSGTVAIDVRDAAGRSLRPSIQVATPGDALLLDYDRASGDALLLSAGVHCGGDSGIRARRCTLTLLRVGPDGGVRQRVAAKPRTTEFLPGSARFMPDGPDADASPEVVGSWGLGSIALLESGRQGTVKPSALAQRELVKWHRRDYAASPLRVFPVLGTGGSRRLVVLLPRITIERYGRERYRNIDRAARPAELRWQ